MFPTKNKIAYVKCNFIYSFNNFFARPVVYECHIYLITTKFKFEGLKIMCTNSGYIQDVST